MKAVKYLALLILLLIFNKYNFAQTEQTLRYRSDNYGNKSERKISIMDGNCIRTLFYNDGQIGSWPNRPSGEWPKGTGKSYLNGYTFFIGNEFIAPGNNQLIHSIASSYREEIDVDAITGENFIMQPLPGYSNSSVLTPAINKNAQSFPTSWPKALVNADDSLNSKWYGLFGNSKSIGDFETFYVMDDSKDKEFTNPPYNFLPVINDPNRGGMGLRVEVRGIASSFIPVQDILFWIYDITNISDYNYNKSILGLFIDPAVGGLNDVGDDRMGFNKEENIVYAFDSDGKATESATFIWNPGYIGFSFLNSQKDSAGNEINLSSVSGSQISNKGPESAWLKNDEVIWNKLAYRNFEMTDKISNLLLMLSVGPIQFEKEETKRVVSCIIMGQTYEELILNKNAAYHFYKNNFSNENYNNIQLVIADEHKSEILKGEVEFNWIILNQAIDNIKVSMFISNDSNNFDYYKSDNEKSGKIVLNTKDLLDGIFYKIKFVCYSIEGYGEYTIDKYFTINNDGNVPPQLKFINPANDKCEIKNEYKIQWLCGDADNDDVNVTCYWGNKKTNSWNLLFSNLSKEITEYNWNTTLLQNGDSYYLKAVLKTVNDSLTIFSLPFSIKNERKYLDGKNYSDLSSTLGTGSFLIAVMNSSNITGDEYILKIIKQLNGDLYYTIKNVTNNNLAVENTLLESNKESIDFDGIRIVLSNDTTKAVIPSLTKWVSGSSNFLFNVYPDNSSSSRNYYQPKDYKLIFHDTGVYITPFYKYMLNMTIKNITDNKDVDYELNDNDRNGYLSIGDDVIMIEYPNSSTTYKITWRVKFVSTSSTSPILPKGGDEYLITTSKQFTDGDQIIFSTKKLLVNISDKALPTEMLLSQNYPNPFNPTTLINYNIPVIKNKSVNSLQHICLKLYDVLGREVAILIDEDKLPGFYQIEFNSKTLPSGVYFYKLNTPTNSVTKKMIIMK